MSRAERPGGPRPSVVLYEPRHRGASLPLGLLHVASALEDARVAIVDGRLEMAPAALVAELAREAVCLGVTAPSGPALLDALEITRAARAAKAGLPVVWGGPHATFRAAECLATGVVDACVLGAGERTFAEVVDALRAGGADNAIPGLAFLRDGQVVESLPRAREDANQLEPPDYGLLDLERHFTRRGARRVEVVTSRGEASAGEAVNALLASRVVALVHDLAARHHVAEVAFVDQGFFEAPRVEGLVRGLEELEPRVAWEATGALGDVTRALLAAEPARLRASGARRLTLVVEEESEQAVPAAQELLQAGLEVRVRLLFGRGRRDAEAARQIHRVARDLLALPGAIQVDLRVYEPWPGSPAAEEILARPGGPEGVVGWGAFDPRAFAPSWLTAPVVGRLDRWSFYLGHASRRKRRRLGPRLVHRLARARVRAGFYGLDLERRAVLGLRRARKALRLEPVALVDD